MLPPVLKSSSLIQKCFGARLSFPIQISISAALLFFFLLVIPEYFYAPVNESQASVQQLGLSSYEGRSQQDKGSRPQPDFRRTCSLFPPQASTCRCAWLHRCTSGDKDTVISAAVAPLASLYRFRGTTDAEIPPP